ncbi:unnamed protein product [Adineta ricciae]|uniref:Uncharacterized protein n=1 Tax=Adineta ricciae TaxID=249248 RepID=A0A815VYM3_ADIRI|nr:unnamed protein product [Adineta ricciae]CAF1534094.1 unnamed protein product [Adineta ricciae]
MLSTVTLITISLLLIKTSLADVPTVQPQNCVCYDPNYLDINNSTVACNTSHCSRGNNPNCNANYPDYTITNLRAFGYYGAIVAYLGCNCPGYNYSNSSYNNAIDGSSNDVYSYTDCNGFGGDDHDDDVVYCCNYCCGLLPIYTTTIVPSAANSRNIVSIYILFSLIFMLIRMIVLAQSNQNISILYH